MEAAAVQWLDEVGADAFWISASLFISVNFLFAAMVYANRDRGFVNRWTGRLLAVDLFLVGTGVGIPLLTATARVAVSAFAPSLTRALPAFVGRDAAESDRPDPR